MTLLKFFNFISFSVPLIMSTEMMDMGEMSLYTTSDNILFQLTRGFMMETMYMGKWEMPFNKTADEYNWKHFSHYETILVYIISYKHFC